MIIPGFYKKLTVFLVLVAVYFVAFFVRYEVAGYQRSMHGFLPFTLESALMYRYADMTADGKEIPQKDIMAQYPEGFEVNKKLTIGQEPFLGTVYRMFFTEKMDLHDLIRYFYPAFFSLSIFAVFLIVNTLTGSCFAGIISALFYAVALPSVIRSTGQEIMCENIALPFIFFHIWAFIKSIVSNEDRKKCLLYSVVCAVLLAAAVMLWDMTQVYIYMLVIFVVLRFLFFKDYEITAFPFIACVMALFIAGLINPYLAWHDFVFSYPMIVSYILTAMTIIYLNKKESRVKARVLFLVLAGIMVVFSVLLSKYSETYSHFIKLFLYKLKFLNEKPADPSLLPYEVRSLWVPALHSVDLRGAIKFFGSLVFVAVIACLFMLFELSRRRLPLGWVMIVFFTVMFIPLFLLFFRLEVFLVFFICLLIGGSIFYFRNYLPRLSYVWIAVLACLFFYEANKTFAGVRHWGRPVDYPRITDITSWIRENTPENSVVLATFSLSPSILAYSDRNIVIHPKYEDPILRDKVKKYDLTVFSESEDDFYTLCKDNDVTHYIHSRGTFSDRSLYGRRYLAGVLKPSMKTNAYKFEVAPGKLKNFKRLYDNGKYSVYKVIGPDDIATAKSFLDDGKHELEEGRYKAAVKLIKKALDVYPGLLEAYPALISAYSQMGEKKKAAMTAHEMFTKMGVVRVENSGNK